MTALLKTLYKYTLILYVLISTAETVLALLQKLTSMVFLISALGGTVNPRLAMDKNYRPWCGGKSAGDSKYVLFIHTYTFV